MRIVSLLPSATEIVCLLGLRSSLVGRSHACDYPADVAEVPVMTHSALPLDEALSSAEIDQQVVARARDGLSLYGLHHDRLRDAQPDLILTQALCDVCAVSADAVSAAVREIEARSGTAARVLSLEPTSIDGIFASILAVGDATGTRDIAEREVSRLRERLDAVRARVADVRHRPSVAALEWLDPPFAPGHWVPEQIEAAGGRSFLGEAGQPSMRITWDDVVWVQPEMIVMAPCGYDVADTVREFLAMSGNEVWRDLPATYLNQLYAVNANAYFSRPGPRVIDGVEVLAGLLHPDRCPRPDPSQAQRVSHLVQAELRL